MLSSLVDRSAGGEAAGVVGELLRAREPRQRAEVVRRTLRAIGFDWLSAGTVTLAQGQMHPHTLFIDCAHPEWVRRYAAGGYIRFDPRHRDIPQSSLPVLWDIERLEAGHARWARDPRLAGFLRDLRECGLHSGMIFRVGSLTRIDEHLLIGLQSRRRGRDWITSEVAGQALMLGLSVQEFLARTADAGVPPVGVKLDDVPPTQQQVLTQLLQGCSDKEIAHRLSLSAHTVDYHMRQLRRRFAVRSRLQLVNAVAGVAGRPAYACA